MASLAVLNIASYSARMVNGEQSKSEVIARLRTRILMLEAEVAELRSTIKPTEGSHEKARRAEIFIAELLGCQIAGHVARHDLVSTKSGIKFEIKFSSLTFPKPSIQYWIWTSILGDEKGKIFDRLILVGETNPKYQAAYADPNSPFVLFDLSFSDASSLMSKHGDIQLNTNPNGLRKPESKLLYAKHRVTREQLCQLYGMA
jgi:hypothetical protein